MAVIMEYLESRLLLSTDLAATDMQLLSLHDGRLPVIEMEGFGFGSDGQVPGSFSQSAGRGAMVSEADLDVQGFITLYVTDVEPGEEVTLNLNGRPYGVVDMPMPIGPTPRDGLPDDSPFGRAVFDILSSDIPVGSHRIEARISQSRDDASESVECRVLSLVVNPTRQPRGETPAIEIKPIDAIESAGAIEVNFGHDAFFDDALPASLPLAVAAEAPQGGRVTLVAEATLLAEQPQRSSETRADGDSSEASDDGFFCIMLPSRVVEAGRSADDRRAAADPQDRDDVPAASDRGRVADEFVDRTPRPPAATPRTSNAPSAETAAPRRREEAPSEPWERLVAIEPSDATLPDPGVETAAMVETRERRDETQTDSPRVAATERNDADANVPAIASDSRGRRVHADAETPAPPSENFVIPAAVDGSVLPADSERRHRRVALASAVLALGFGGHLWRLQRDRRGLRPESRATRFDETR